MTCTIWYMFRKDDVLADPLEERNGVTRRRADRRTQDAMARRTSEATRHRFQTLPEIDHKRIWERRRVDPLTGEGLDLQAAMRGGLK